MEEKNPKCFGVIPDTFIACGEGGQFCSDECLYLAMMKQHDAECPMSGHPNAPCECKTKNLGL